MISDSLREKIKKLFDMAEMGTENEAAVAMQKAHELMKAHGITQDDVNLYTIDMPASLKKGRWLSMLVELCGEFSGVICLVAPKTICFAGDEIGVNIARELFAYLKNEIERQLKKTPIKGRKLKNDFRIGCIIGLLDKMEMLGGWRDMQEKRKRIRDTHFSKTGTHYRNKRCVDGDCLNAGKESAEDININRQTGVQTNGLIGGHQ